MSIPIIIPTDLEELEERLGVKLPWEEQVKLHLARKDEFREIQDQLFTELKQESILQN